MRHTGKCRGPVRSLISALRTNAVQRTSLAPKLRGEPSLQKGCRNSSADACCSGTRRLRTAAGHARTEPSAASDSSARSTRRRGASPVQPLPASCRSYANSSSSSPSPLRKRAPVECGVVSPRRTVPDHIPKTPYYATGAVPPQDNIIHLHTAETLVPMREACVLARDMLDLCCAMAQPGVTTDAIDAAVHAAIIEAGACPSPLNYHGFPKSVCSSVNEVACHAIPDDRPLQDGDLVSFDVSVFLNGFHGDNCATVGVGTIDAAGQRLMDATEEAMMQGVSVCRPGACLTEIGSAIHAVADHYGFDTVQKYCGHGVGSGFHMQPFVQHFRNNHQLELTPGMTFTIEPIFTEGSEATTLWRDAWTVQTVDGGRAAQFEHVVLITDEGHEVLTVPSQPVVG